MSRSPMVISTSSPQTLALSTTPLVVVVMLGSSLAWLVVVAGSLLACLPMPMMML